MNLNPINSKKEVKPKRISVTFRNSSRVEFSNHLYEKTTMSFIEYLLKKIDKDDRIKSITIEKG